MTAPDKDGVYERRWLGRTGQTKRRRMLVRGDRVLDLRDGEWRPRAWFDGLPGQWEWVQAHVDRAGPDQPASGAGGAGDGQEDAG